MGEKARALSPEDQLIDDQAHYARAVENRRHAHTPVGRTFGSLAIWYYNSLINEDVDAIEIAEYSTVFPLQSPPPEQELTAKA